jgi:signal transduction histidine kinase
VLRREDLGRPIRAALFLGFGLIVVTWVITGYYFTRRMADVERQAAAINHRYMQAQELLSTVRAQVLLVSVYVRDALMDPDPTTAVGYRARVDDLHGTIDLALQQYVPVLDSPAERQQVTRLRGEIAAFHDTMLDLLATDSARWAAEARTLLRTRVMPERELVIRLSEETQALNRGAFIQQQSAVASVYGITQRRIWQTLGIALATSLGIALLATLYAGRLEDRIRLQRAKDVQNTRDLQHLSARLLSAQEEERRSIARELHDEVGQALTAMKVELVFAQRAINGTDGAAHALDEVRGIADGVLQTVRDLSHLLHPALLDDLGLAAATEWYLKGFCRRHGVHADLVYDGCDDRLAPETEVAVYRIIQEALTNVAKHANASSCRVYLQRLTNTLLVTIEDDGVGFSVVEMRSAGGSHGLGLVSIRERASHLRGTVRLESNLGKGTRLTVEVPALPRLGSRDVSRVEPSPTDNGGTVGPEVACG